MKQKPSRSTTAGEAAELACANFLQQQGLRLLSRNYRFKGGEIDLILQQGSSLLIFVEVRMRNHLHFGSGAESVTPSKQRRITRTTLHYLQKHPALQEFDIRFDVISVTGQPGNFQFDWFKEAFWPGDQ